MRAKKCRGQSLVLIALGIIVLLGFVAFAVDFGQSYSVRQKIRNNVDAAALAGGQSLPTASSAKTAAANYYALNMGLTSNDVVVLSNSGNTTQYLIGSDTVDITTPYSDSKTQAQSVAASDVIRVYACRNVQHHFGSLFGLTSTQYCLRSVAIKNNGGNAFAVWAAQNFIIDGNNNVINGSTHSNQTLQVDGNNNVISSSAFYVSSANITGQNNVINPVQTSTKTMPEPPNTVDYYKSLAQANGTYFTGNKTFGDHNSTLSGVIFVENGDLTISGNNMSGTATFVTQNGKITFSGNNSNFTAAVDKLLAYVATAQEIEISGNNATFQGTVYATGGEIEAEGNNFTVQGAVISGSVIELDRNNALITYDTTYTWGAPGAGLFE